MQFGTCHDDQVLGLAVDGGGNTYSVGSTSPRCGYGWIAKYSPAGDRLWDRQIDATGCSGAKGVAVDATGNVVVAGFASAAKDQDPVGFVAKYAPDGTSLWRSEFGYEGSAQATSVAVGDAGKIHVAGHVAPAGGGVDNRDAFLGTYTADGSLLWERRPSTVADDVANGVATDRTGGVVVAGSTRGSFKGGNAGGYDVWAMKYDANGNPAWTFQRGTVADDEGYAIATDAAGNAYIAGKTNGALAGIALGSSDAFVAKLSPAGAVQWGKQFGTDRDDEANAVATSGTWVYVGGLTRGSLAGANSGGADAFTGQIATK